MRKGITPVIAMILLILIVVALGGVFAAWTTRTWETLGEAGEEQIETVTEQLQKSIRIDSVECKAVGVAYIKNMGGSDVFVDELGVYVDNAKVVHACTECGNVPPNDGLQAGEIGTVTGLGNLDAVATGTNIEVKIIVSGNSATYICKA